MSVDRPNGWDCQDRCPKNACTAQYHQIRTIRPQLFTAAWAIVIVHGMARDVRPSDKFSDPRWHGLTGNAREELSPLFGSFLRDLFNDEARYETPFEQDAQHFPTVGMLFENEKGEMQGHRIEAHQIHYRRANQAPA